MPRTTVAYLLTIVLLACPHFCLGKSASEVGVRPATISFSCNCGRQEPVDTPADAPDNGDPDCLCQGAVLADSKVEATDADVDNWLPLLVAPKCGAASDVHTASSDPLFPGHSPAIVTGWDICVLTCAMLL
jgi:hypothetical protein